MGFLSSLGTLIGVGAAPFTGGASLALPAILGGVGAGLSGASQASAANRGTQLEAALAQEQVNQQRNRDLFEELMARESSQREGMKSSMKDMQHADYIINTHPGDSKPATVTIMGKQVALPSYGSGYKAPGPGETEGAYALADQARQRLLNGGTLTPAPKDRGEFAFDPKLLRGSTWERLSGLLGGGLQAYGSLASGQGGGGGNRPMDWTFGSYGG